MSGSLAIRESGSLEQPGSLPPVTCSQEGLNLLHLLHLLNLLNLLRGPNCGHPYLATWQRGGLAACQFGNLALWQLRVSKWITFVIFVEFVRGPNCGPPNMAAWQSGSLAACQFGNLAIRGVYIYYIC